MNNREQQMATFVPCIDTSRGKQVIMMMDGDAMKLMLKGYENMRDICFYVHRDEKHDKVNLAAYSISRFTMEHKPILCQELKGMKSAGNVFISLDRKDKDGVMRYVIAVVDPTSEQTDPVGLAISRMQGGSIYWFLSKVNRDCIFEWITELKKDATPVASCK